MTDLRLYGGKDQRTRGRLGSPDPPRLDVAVARRVDDRDDAAGRVAHEPFRYRIAGRGERVELPGQELDGSVAAPALVQLVPLARDRDLRAVAAFPEAVRAGVVVEARHRRRVRRPRRLGDARLLEGDHLPPAAAAGEHLGHARRAAEGDRGRLVGELPDSAE